MLLRVGQVDVAVASSRDAAEDVLRTHDINFASRAMLAGSKIADQGIVFSPYGDHWRLLRKLATIEFFTVRRVRSFATIRKEQVLSMINNIKTAALSRTPVNVGGALMWTSSSIVAAAAVGTRCRQQEKLLKLVDEVVKLVSGFSVADLFPSLKFVDVLTGMSSKTERMRRELKAIIDEIISDKEMCKSNGGGDKHSTKKEEEEDILDVLLRRKDDENQEFPITPSVVKDVILVRT
uniref:Uncharacterized protein n=1 Tax=Ananas comosus var. bracteatus TaxID=296719 RepID=A0A6V7Q715_ANACO|nr:unnamed protein product [Ananas comosus var. bracteatus]